VAQEGSQQVEPMRSNEDSQEVQSVRAVLEQVLQDESQEAQVPLAKNSPSEQERQFVATPVHVKQFESQFEQVPLLVKYCPSAQLKQFVDSVPLHVAQVESQQVEPFRTNGELQDVHASLPAAEQPLQDDSQTAQAPVAAKYLPVRQERQFELVIPLQVAQKG